MFRISEEGVSRKFINFLFQDDQNEMKNAKILLWCPRIFHQQPHLLNVLLRNEINQKRLRSTQDRGDQFSTIP